MIEIINTALEATVTVLNLMGICPVVIRYLELLLMIIWFSKFISKSVWKIQIKFNFLNQRIYYSLKGLD